MNEHVFDKWFEEILQRDMQWFRRIKEEYDKINSDFPVPVIPNQSTKERMTAYRKARFFLRTYPMFIHEAVTSFKGEVIAEKGFRKDLERRKQNLIFKIENKVGKIIDVSIKRNPNGGFDGNITGNKGKVRIETIGAGGYNIQRFHYRTLIK